MENLLTRSFEIWTFAGHDIACILYILYVQYPQLSMLMNFVFFSNEKIVLYCALLYIIHLYNTILQLYKVLKYRNFNYYLHYTIQYTVYCVL